MGKKVIILAGAGQIGMAILSDGEAMQCEAPTKEAEWEAQTAE